MVSKSFQKHIFCILFIVFTTLVFPISHIRSQDIFEEQALESEAVPTQVLEVKEVFVRGVILEILQEGVKELDSVSSPWQRIKVRLTLGDEKGKEIEVSYGEAAQITERQKLAIGEQVVVLVSRTPEATSYSIVEHYRIPSIIIIFIIFFIFVVVFSGKRGVSALLGLAFTIFLIAWYILPNLLSGEKSLPTVLIGSTIAVLFSLLVSHGFNVRSFVAILGTFITLAFSTGLAVLFVHYARLFGLGSEESFYLQAENIGSVDLSGVLLAGIIIGMLGVLDDVTTSQTAAVVEIKKANPSLGFFELYRRGLAVGKEHIAALVNTLALAYVGASLPLFLLYFSNRNPWWVFLNSEFVSEEIIRILAGSSALVLAVPIVTFMAAIVFGRKS